MYTKLVEIAIDEYLKDSHAFKQVIGQNIGSPVRCHYWNYMQVVRMHNYMSIITRPGISIAVRKYARHV